MSDYFCYYERLRSFSTPESAVSSQLAISGLYFKDSKIGISCYECSFFFRTPILSSVQDIRDIHERHFSNCASAKIREEGISKLSCFDKPKHRCIVQSEIQPRLTTLQEKPPTILQSTKTAELRRRNFEEMRFAAARLRSFTSLRVPDIFLKLKTLDIVDEGFFFAAPALMQCAFCDVAIDINEISARVSPAKLHQSLDSACRVSRQRHNIRIPYKCLKAFETLLHTRKEAILFQALLLGLRVLQIDEFPEFRSYSSRLSSLEGLCLTNECKIYLAQNGIFHCFWEDASTLLRCYACGIQLPINNVLYNTDLASVHSDQKSIYCNHMALKSVQCRWQEAKIPCFRCRYNPVHVQLFPCMHRPFCAKCCEEEVVCPFCKVCYIGFAILPKLLQEFNGWNCPEAAIAASSPKQPSPPTLLMDSD